MLKLKVCGGGQVEGVIWRNVKLKKDGEGRVKWIDRYNATEKKPLRKYAQRLKFQKNCASPVERTRRSGNAAGNSFKATSWHTNKSA